MKRALTERADLFISNRDIFKQTFKLESFYLYPVCAAILTQRGVKADATHLLACKAILKERVGVFSNFRSTAYLAMIAMLSVADDPHGRLLDSLAVYDALKAHFMTNSFLPVASMAIAEAVSPAQYETVSARTKQIYKLLREAHPFLTSGEDSVFAALLALSPLSDEAIAEQTERCYELLKPHFSAGNGVQSLSHVLALCDGREEDKCFRASELYEMLRDRGCKYGKTYELGTLGILAMLPERTDVIADNVAEVDEWLKTQSGYGFFGVGARQRLMHAGLIVNAAYTSENSAEMQAASVSSTIAMIAAQQAAMCAAIAASQAANAAT